MTMEEKTEGNNALCYVCGKSILCEPCKFEPQGMQSFEHICFDCYQKAGGQPKAEKEIHVCLPPEKMAEEFQKFMDEMTFRAFSEMWDEDKKKLRELSKQELAEASFFEGARFMFAFMQRMSQENEQRLSERK